MATIQKHIFKILNEKGKVVEKYDFTGRGEILVNTARAVLKNNLKYGQKFEEDNGTKRERKSKKNIVASAMNFNVTENTKIGFKTQK